MSGREAVNPFLRRKFAAIVREHPGFTAEELRGQLSVYHRAVFGTVLLALREGCEVRIDEHGRIWPTT